MSYIKHSHCSFCGTSFFGETQWPRKCTYCYQTSYFNPVPAVAIILNVWDNNKLGTLIQQRNIEPMKGHWALTSGYMDKGEIWQETAAREAHEELGLKLEANEFALATVESNTDHSVLIIFGWCTRPIFMDEIHFSPNEEVSAIKIIHEPIELAFPTHTEILKERFKNELQ